MLLTLATGIVYFTFVVTGPVALGRLCDPHHRRALLPCLHRHRPRDRARRGPAAGRRSPAQRMPRRPVHPGPAAGWWTRIGEMLKDVRTWTTLAYLLIMLPLGIIYFTLAVTGLSVSAAFIGMPLLLLAQRLGWSHFDFADDITVAGVPGIPDSIPSDHPIFASVAAVRGGPHHPHHADAPRPRPGTRPCAPRQVAAGGSGSVSGGELRARHGRLPACDSSRPCCAPPRCSRRRHCHTRPTRRRPRAPPRAACRPAMVICAPASGAP